MKLYSLIGGFGLGVGIGSFSDSHASLALFGLALAAALSAYARIAVPAERRKLWAVPLLALGFALGAARVGAALPGPEGALDALLGSEAELAGTVIAEPDARDSYARIVVEVGAASGTERVVASVPRYPEFEYGDRVVLSGKLVRPVSKSGSGSFDYAAYLAKDGVRYEMKFGTAELESKGGGSAVRRSLFSFKAAIARRIASVLPEPSASLLGGILLGSKESMGKEILDGFRAAGLTHIVVLSGYNIALIADTAQKAFSFLPRVFGFGAGAASVVAVALMAGGSASVVRAAVMSLLALLARATRRTHDALRLLMLAGLAMVVANPLILAFDPSFALSFLATLGLITVTPLAERHASFVTERWGMREIAASTVATQAFVMPFIMFMSGEASLVSFAANLAVLPFVPATMLLGAIAAAAAFASHAVGVIAAFPAYVLLSYVLAAASAFALLPFATVPVPLPFWGAAAVYALFAALIIRFGGAPEREAGRFDTSLAYELVD